MWPWSSTPRAAASRDELDDIQRRLKLVERECDDLHAAYRRLRGSRAAEAKAELRAPKDYDDGGGEAPQTKAELRRRFLGKPS